MVLLLSSSLMMIREKGDFFACYHQFVVLNPHVLKNN